MAAILLAWLDIDPQRNLTPGHGAKAIFDAAEPSADQSKQVAGLRERIVPRSEMTCRAGDLARCDQIAIGEQDWGIGLLSFDPRGVDRHHVGTIRKIGDAAKALGLALGAIGS